MRDHFIPRAKGGRPGRMGGPEQAAAKEVLKKEGIIVSESIRLGGRGPDGVNPRPNAKGGRDYFEVGKMLKKGTPESRERIKLKDEIKAMGENDTVTFVDKSHNELYISCKHSKSAPYIRRVFLFPGSPIFLSQLYSWVQCSALRPTRDHACSSK